MFTDPECCRGSFSGRQPVTALTGVRCVGVPRWAKVKAPPCSRNDASGEATTTTFQKEFFHVERFA